MASDTAADSDKIQGDSILFGVGNPLLDISATCDDDFLKKYDLKANDAILAGEKHAPLFDEMISKYEVQYIAGGSTQNSMRVTQWILGQPKTCVMMGCVGKDKFGDTLRDKATEAGVNVRYQYTTEYPTGTCAVIITKGGKCRSLVTKLEAANHFSKSHLEVPANKDLIDKAKFYYLSGFFLTVSPDSMVELGKHACERNKFFMINLSAEFLCQFFSEPMMKTFPYVDILFGNETEAAKFSEIQKFGLTDVKEIAIKASGLPKANPKRSRMVIFTQGAENIIIAKDGKITEYPVTRLPDEKIIDTNGAGDAFVGGFLAQFIQEKPLEECVKCGIWAATQIIQRSGCTCPTDITYVSNSKS